MWNTLENSYPNLAKLAVPSYFTWVVIRKYHLSLWITAKSLHMGERISYLLSEDGGSSFQNTYVFIEQNSYKMFMLLSHSAPFGISNYVFFPFVFCKVPGIIQQE